MRQNTSAEAMAPPLRRQISRVLVNSDISELPSTEEIVLQEVVHEQEAPQELAQVYLFDCCGATRELKPAHAHLSAFKQLFLLIQVFVFLFGLGNFGLGLWFRIDPKVYEIHKYIETQNFTIAGWLQLIAGFTACLWSLIGCLAAGSQNVSLLLVYLLVLIALMIAFVSTIIMLTIYGLGSTLELFLVKELYEQMRRKTMSPEVDVLTSNDAAQFMDFVQVKMRCCGAADFRDYQKLGMVVPTTCYTIAGNYLNAPGCGRAIRRLLDIRAGLATGFSTGSAVSQLVAILAACLLICAIHSWRTRGEHSDRTQEHGNDHVTSGASNTAPSV